MDPYALFPLFSSQTILPTPSRVFKMFVFVLPSDIWLDAGEKCNVLSGARTYDKWLTRPMLYRLCYATEPWVMHDGVI